MFLKMFNQILGMTFKDGEHLSERTHCEYVPCQLALKRPMLAVGIEDPLSKQRVHEAAELDALFEQVGAVQHKLKIGRVRHHQQARPHEAHERKGRAVVLTQLGQPVQDAIAVEDDAHRVEERTEKGDPVGDGTD